MYLSHILHIIVGCFHYKNGNGDPIMVTGKNHSIVHTLGYVASYCDSINVSCDAAEIGGRPTFSYEFSVIPEAFQNFR